MNPSQSRVNKLFLPTPNDLTAVASFSLILIAANCEKYHSVLLYRGIHTVFVRVPPLPNLLLLLGYIIIDENIEI